MSTSKDESDNNQCNKLKTKDTSAHQNDDCSASALTQVTPTELMTEEDSEKDCINTEPENKTCENREHVSAS